MPEYGVLVAIIVLGALVAVATFGQNVASYFTGTADVLESGGHPVQSEDGAIEFVFLPEPPVVIDDPFGFYDPDENWLIGTDYADGLILDGSHVGVYGLSEYDEIRGTSANEIFVGGKGNDRIRGGGGENLYAWTAGHGSDWIDESGGDAATDTLYFPFIAQGDVSARKFGNSDDLLLLMPSGEQIGLVGYFTTFNYGAHFERTVLSDAQIEGSQAFRNWVAESQKATGSVYGTKALEEYVHTAATDGGYTIYDNQYLRTGDIGTLTFTDQEIGDIALTNDFANNSSMDVRTSDGDVIRLYQQNQSKLESGVKEIRFAGSGTSIDVAQMRTKAADDMKATGTVTTTRWTETLFHDMAKDGSYTLRNNHYLGDPLETFVIRNATPDQVKFLFTGQNSQTDFRMTFEDGDVVTILNGFEDPSTKNDEGIKDILFEMDPGTTADDILMDVAAITEKQIADNIMSGFVRGYQGSETIVYDLSMPVELVYYPGYGFDSYVDTLDLSVFDDDGSVTFSARFSDINVYMPGGRRITLKGAVHYNQSVERLILGDGAGGTVDLNEATIRARAGL